MVEGTQTVLIVDDDHVILDFLEDVLQRSYTVIRASNGKSAVDAFRAHDQIDLVLLDLNMPEMSGYEALAEFQIVEPDVKVVVITGMSPEHDELPGILGVLTKPFQAQQIITVVEDVLAAYP
jgi:CheY-like chemotaxis protein